VGINPLPFFDGSYWHNSNPSAYEAYVQTLARFAEWLIERGHTVVFFPTQLRVDPGVIRDIRLSMKSNGSAAREWQLIESQVRSFDDLVTQISSVDVVTATRYHGILISFLLHKPVLGLAYHSKSRDLMALMGQAEYALDVDSCNVDALKERFQSLESSRGEIAQDISRRLPSVQEAVAIQYDEVFRLLEEGSSRSTDRSRALASLPASARTPFRP
jgi:polysaccharide pyruvyl transferase WcaK-like protein